MTAPVRTDDDIPTAAVRRRRLSTTWIVPLAAIVFAGVLLVTHLARERGPTIEIRFDDAAGLTSGAEIIHRGIAVGVVRRVRPAPGLDAALVTAELAPEAAALASEGTQFWVVRPEVSLQRISGLDTLIGPRYIGVRPGPSDAPERFDFTALPGPPAVTPAQDGSLRLTLRAGRLGSLAPGSPVLYREIRVGAVRSAHLAPDATGVLVVVDIEPRFAPLVRENTRFWRTGGVGLDFGLFSGLSVRAESLTHLVTSAVALATPNRPGPPVQPGAAFDLAESPENDWTQWSPEIDLGGTP